jgi:hypothetical protein
MILKLNLLQSFFEDERQLTSLGVGVACRLRPTIISGQILAADLERTQALLWGSQLNILRRSPWRNLGSALNICKQTVTVS